MQKKTEARSFQRYKAATTLLKCNTLFQHCLDNNANLTPNEELLPDIICRSTEDICQERFDACIKESYSASL